MLSSLELLRKVPNFPNYTSELWGYPERTLNRGESSLVVLGPPIHLYHYLPTKNCTVHVSGIPDWSSMGDVADIFAEFGKIFSVELSVKMETKKKPMSKPSCNGWALVTYCSYDGAQNACFAHLTRRIPGTVIALSIYKGIVNNVVLLKNLPKSLSKAQILSHINGYPGVISISFVKETTARMVFEDLDYALLFMDLVSGGGLIMDGFTCTVEPEDLDEIDDDDCCSASSSD